MKGKAHHVVTELIAESWEPRQSDIAFLKNLLDGVKDGGIWGVPMNGQRYTINHTDKTMTLTDGKLDNIFHRTRAIAAKLGYRVLVASDEQHGHITVTECGITR